MVGTVRLVGEQIHQQDGLPLQLGGAAGFARCHQRDAVVAPEIFQLPAILQHEDGVGEAGVHRVDGFVQSAQGVERGLGDDSLVLRDDPNAVGRTAACPFGRRPDEPG